MPSAALLYAAAMICTTVASVCGNITLLLVLALNQGLRTETWALTLSVCLSDLALGLCTVPFGVHNSLLGVWGGAGGSSGEEGRYTGDGPLCWAAGFSFVLFQLASLHSLTWATVDKFTEICFALQYPRLFTKSRSRGSLALLWLYSLLSATLPLLGCGSYRYSAGRFICAPSFPSSGTGLSLLFLGVGVIAPILVICSLYTYLVYIARSQALRGTFICNEQHCHYVPAKNYFRSSMVMTTTLACLLVCWLPYIITCFYEVFTSRESPVWANALATWLVLLTSALNPWINCMTQK
ncbi:adenosine receptor A3 [Paramormyrops kingsleyae]|uniref:adenosine receptor A3 n=1 Tax=Paramormyrops kingsleyae TaxID=1676925 RepID=UPI003B9732FB